MTVRANTREVFRSLLLHEYLRAFLQAEFRIVALTLDVLWRHNQMFTGQPMKLFILLCWMRFSSMDP